MGIANRSKDASEQKQVISEGIQDTVTAEAELVYHVPRAMNLLAAKSVAVGLSGAPTSTLRLNRFVAGVGLTTISISSALTAVAIGTSGVQSFSLSASSIALQKDDVIDCLAGGTNAALKSNMVSLVVQDLQDIKSFY